MGPPAVHVDYMEAPRTSHLLQGLHMLPAQLLTAVGVPMELVEGRGMNKLHLTGFF